MKYTIIIFFLFVKVFNIQSQQKEVDVFLNKEVVKTNFNNIKFISSIDYTPNGFLLLSSLNQFYMLGLENISIVFNETKTPIDAFTVTQESALWVVSNNKLYNIDSKKNLSFMFNLPISKVGIVSGNNENIVYIYDQTFQKNKKEYAVYQISNNGIYARLLSIPTPILSVCEYKTNLLLSTENKILCADSETKTFFDLFSLPQKQNIISITSDTLNHAIYFSTQDSIYRIQNGKPEYISTDFGGILKYDGEGLLIFNPEKQLIIRFRNNILYPPTPEEKKKKELPPLELNMNEIPEAPNLTTLLNEPRNLILNGQIPQAINAYAQLVSKDETNSCLLSEYAYALALGGIYEGALMNLDRAKLLGTFLQKDYFHVGQVFALMGNYRLATDLLSNSSVPKWVYPKYNELYQTYKSPILNQQEDDAEMLFKRVNYLASANMNFQAIALYEQLTEVYPDEYIFHIGYSIPLEKVGLSRLAAEELETGISLMPDDSKFDEAKQAFNQRLLQLKQKPEKVVAHKQSKFIEELNKFNPQTMLYAGGMYSKNYTSFNTRFGIYLSNSFNGALNLGVSGNSTATYFNLGLSGYQRFGNILVLGCGLSDQISKGNNVFSATSSLGLSFINSKRNSSWDIFFNANIPLKKGTSNMYGISIGKSFYFGSR